MSRARTRSSNKILKWIRACKSDGATRHGELYECVLEKRLGDRTTKTRDPSRIEGNRIDRAICKAMGRKVSRTGICK